MTLKDFKDWLKTKVICPNWYIGKIDGSKDQCIGIYNLQGPPPNLAVGGLNYTSYASKGISILVHWGTSPDIAEQKAQEVYNNLLGQTATMNGKRVINFDMKYSEPVSVGTDENDVYEYVIELIIYYGR